MGRIHGEFIKFIYKLFDSSLYKRNEIYFEELMKIENLDVLNQGYEEIRIKLGDQNASIESSKIIFNI